jgi:hypothetical protein
MTDNKQIAKTILEQLGGNKFRVMTGAKNFIAIDSGLGFSIPGGGGFAKSGINVVKVILTPADLYDMEFMRSRGGTVTTVEKFEGLFFDQLQPLFTQATGLRTSF